MLMKMEIPWRNYVLKNQGDASCLDVLATLNHADDGKAFHVRVDRRHIICEKGGRNYDIIKKIVLAGHRSSDHKKAIVRLFDNGFDLPYKGNRIKVDGLTVSLDGELLDPKWFLALCIDPNVVWVLLANVGDKITVKGDEDAPDGEYQIMGIDNTDPTQRLYLETEDGFLGYVKNSSIKEVHHAHP